MKKHSKKTLPQTAIPEIALTPPKKLKKKKRTTIHPPIEAPKPVVIPVEKPDDSSKIRPDSIIFYGHPIRCTYMNNQWYFSLEDILKIAKVIDPTKFLIDLKNQTDLKEEYYKLVETFSYYEGDNPIIIPIVNFQSFKKLMPHIRLNNLTFPGPLPDWLENMANRRL